MIRLSVDKIASATKNVPLRRDLRVSPEITSKDGYLIAGRIRGEKSVYNMLENCQGRLVPLHDGDIVVGALGHRNALLGYSGVVPKKISKGDVLHILNMGGVIGKCTSANPDLGSPFEIEVLGGVCVFPEFGKRSGVPAHVKMNALEERKDLSGLPNIPVIFVAATCMNAGKTTASCQIIRYLSGQGLKVGACKLTGVSLLRDTLGMQDYGATHALSFVDVGIVTTSAATALESARTILGNLSETDSDVIVAELGDGIMGEYGVGNILADSEIMARKALLIVCANDPVGAWGAVRFLKEKFELEADLMSGPVTDNDVGVRFIEQTLGVPAMNARLNNKAFGSAVHDKLREKIS